MAKKSILRIPLFCDLPFHEDGLQKKAMLGTTFLNVSYFEGLRNCILKDIPLLTLVYFDRITRYINGRSKRPNMA